MKVVVELSESELYRLKDLLDCKIESPEDAEYAIHQVMRLLEYV